MIDSMAFNIALFIFGLLLSAFSHVPMKISGRKQYKNKIAEYANPLVIFAYFLCVMTTVCTVIAYRVVPLSLGGVLATLEYIFVALIGFLFFKERASRRKLLGLAVIVFGAILYQI